MHITGTLISGAVSAVTGASSGGAFIGSGFSKADKETNYKLAGYVGAFVFAAQMINFTIPSIDSSGHFAGGFLLACLLGSRTSYMVMALVLAVQAFLFGDGGLVALGCNIFNMGFIPCIVVYPMVQKLLKNKKFHLNKNVLFALGGWLSVMIGALAVVVETLLSGITNISLASFASNMLTVHALIGIAEAIITVVIVFIVGQLRKVKYQKIFLGITSIVTAGVLSLYASAYPDGLEWSLEKVGYQEVAATNAVHLFLDQVQGVTAVFNDYQWALDSKYFSFAGVAGVIAILAIVSCIEKRRTKEVIINV